MANLYYKIAFIVCSTLLYCCSNNYEDNSNNTLTLFNVSAINNDSIIDFNNQALILSEVSIRNSSISDENGSYSDWIEVYNKSNSTIDLSNYYLSDNENSEKWNFPNILLQPKSYFSVLASSKTQNRYKDHSDSTEIKFSSVWAWADSHRDIDPGESTLLPWKFDSIMGVYNDKIAISAIFTLVDNSKLDNNLTWAANTLKLNFDENSKKIDFTIFDQFTFQGYIDKDEPLNIQFIQSDLENYDCYQATVIGTGVENDNYTISLINVPTLDLSKLISIEIKSKENQFTSVHATLHSFTFFKKEILLSTNFSLSIGEKLTLYNKFNGSKDSIKISDTFTNGSISRNINNGDWINTQNSTFNSANIPIPKYLFKTIHYPKSGFYSSQIEVKVVAVEGSKIYYTLDGSTPDTNSSIYNSKITLTSTKVLKTKSFTNYSSSPTTTSTYFINENIDLPVFSMSADSGGFFDNDTGIYSMGNYAEPTFPFYGANFWSEKEIPVNIEFFEDDNSFQFNDNVLCKLSGNFSRALEKKSFSFKFTEQYGSSSLNQALFKYKFPNLKKFNNFLLRANGNHKSKTTFRDGLMTTIISNVGINTQKYRPAVLFINGEYWGIYGIREKINENYFNSNFGISTSNINLLKDGITVQNGNCDSWFTMMDFVRNNNFKDSINYKYISNSMDIDNFIDYNICEMYIVNTDWPSKNFRVYNTSNPTSKWRWMIYDTDFSFGGFDSYSNLNMLQWATNSDTTLPQWPNGAETTILLRKVLENDQFKKRFINRASVISSYYFNPEKVIDSINSFARNVESEIYRDYERWNLNYIFENEVEELRQFAIDRQVYFMEHLMNFFNFTDFYRTTFYVNGSGAIKIEGKTINTFPTTLTLFQENKVEIEAIETKFSKFVKWSDGVTDKKRTVSLENYPDFVAYFK